MARYQSREVYTCEVWKDAHPGYWAYLIRDPDGNDHVSGSRKGTRKEAMAHVQSCLDRLHDCAGSSVWNSRPGRKPKPQKEAA